MATGDAADFASRIRSVLGGGNWFPTTAPVLNGILTGMGAAWGVIYTQIQYVTQQTRIATATGAWLDGMSLDYFGGSLPRLAAETDTAFSARIRANLAAKAGTRAAIYNALLAITGRAPIIVQPDDTGDTGGYYNLAQPSLGGGIGYGVAGAYGNLSSPFSYFVTAFRPSTTGIGGVNGWGGYLGGYGVGAIEYANLTFEQGQITDAVIQTTVANVTDAGITAWMRISN